MTEIEIGKAKRARQAYSITAVNEFEELFDDIYRFSEAQGLEIDTLNHDFHPKSAKEELKEELEDLAQRQTTDEGVKP